MSEVHFLQIVGRELARSAAELLTPVNSLPDEKQTPTPVHDVLDPTILLAALLDEPELVAATFTLFRDGHYAEAVEEAFKLVNNEVKRRAGSPIDGSGANLDGTNLMQQVFRVDRPMLRLSSMTTQSQKDEQDGYRFLFAGSMLGIRNPRAHAHNLNDDPKQALELLVFANHLLRVLRNATRVRRRRTP